MDAFLGILERFQVESVDEPKEYSWGPRAVRFYDPDRHIIEVAEDLVMVMRRFADRGMSAEEVTVRMDAPVSYINDHWSGTSGGLSGGLFLRRFRKGASGIDPAFPRPG